MYTFSLAFHPLGNTPAVNLLRDYPPHQPDPQRILLLGCGDARNVLFTVEQAGSAYGHLDFTLCDIEPAVIARDILLFTLLHDHADAIGESDAVDILDALWSFHADFHISQRHLHIIQAQAHRLSRSSKTLSEWQDSPYNKLIAITTKGSVAALHKCWSAYCKDNDLAIAGDIGRTFRIQMKISQSNPNDLVGNTILRCLEPQQKFPGALEAARYVAGEYWKSGTSLDIGYDTSQNVPLHINPSFAYSSSNYARSSFRPVR
ncbi:Hypothetical protein D9617_2g055640 [Elsinoe fawcettii]|nr:Hypothetical protein D9617_2g055640 [Elsinoe fawcettii]